MRFRDRAQAGRELAGRLASVRRLRPIVLALPRGGVPVAAEVARALEAPLDVFLVRKLGAPFQPELGIGAIAEGGEVYLDARIDRLGIDPAALEAVRAREEAELRRRVRAFRGDRPLPQVAGRAVVLVDDGIATGGTMHAAVRALRRLGAERVIVATPVAPPEAVAALAEEADDVVAVEQPDDLWAIGSWYDDFRQLDDDEVVETLERARGERRPSPEASGEPVPIVVPVGGAALRGDLGVPAGARGVVLFAHGSGSGRKSPRNRFVASVLRDAGLATLLLDLLTDDEERIDAITGELRFDVDLLAERLGRAVDWLAADARTAGLPIGLFGSSTGAAAALIAAADRAGSVAAVVSRGGRPDLALPRLAEVRAPTLLVVGGDDTPVIDLNRAALAALGCEKRMVIVPHATHLFEEPGALEEVSRLAAGWFRAHLAPPDATLHP